MPAPAPVSSATTELPEGGFEAAAPPADGLRHESSHLRLSAGGLLTTGNSRTLALTSAIDHGFRDGPSQLRTTAAFNFGMSAHDPAAPYRTSVENYAARVRYDHFFAPRWAAFLGTSLRRDRFQGLALRLNVDPGIAHYFIAHEVQRLWVELSYDLQHDYRHDSALEAADGLELELVRRDTRHGGRLFAGYDHHASELVSFSAGLEYVQSFELQRHWRAAADGVLSVHLDEAFSLALTLSIKHENDPLPGVRQTDSMTSFSLVYTL